MESKMESKMIELNPNMQYILCGDISASMQERDPKCGNDTRYNYMLEKFKSFIKEAEDFDPDGPTIILFGEDVKVYENTTLEKVQHNLSNISFQGFTNTHLAVKEAYRIHQRDKSDATCVFIFTDGQPTNELALERTIRDIANSVSKEDEFNIGFILTGTVPGKLREYLNKLDDGLGAKYDIVGVREIEGLTFLKAVNNAVNE